MEHANRKIVLENGRSFYGTAFGARVDAVHELVFNTNMVGYQEIVSDLANAGQIVLMTYPLIGNYGMTDEDFESKRLALGGFVTREYSRIPSNFRFTKTLDEILEESGIPGIGGVDTRMLTRIIRDQGVQRALITDGDTPHEACLERLAAYTVPTDLIEQVSCKRPYFSRTANHLYNIVIIDCGLRLNVVRQLNDRRCNVTVMPHDTRAEEVLAQRPDGLVICGGPGDPAQAVHAIQLVRTLRGAMPIFGIGLGHQIVCRAYGAETYRRRLGHRGGYPVKCLLNGRIAATSQNHGYDVDSATLAATSLQVSHQSLADDSAEGVIHGGDRVMTAQFYPDGAPGAQDWIAMYDSFIEQIREGKQDA